MGKEDLFANLEAIEVAFLTTCWHFCPTFTRLIVDFIFLLAKKLFTATRIIRFAPVQMRRDEFGRNFFSSPLMQLISFSGYNSSLVTFNGIGHFRVGVREGKEGR